MKKSLENKNALFIGFLVILFFAPILSASSIPQTIVTEPNMDKDFEISAGENWLSGWDYRKSINITGSAGAGANYTIEFDVEYGSGSDSGNTVYTGSKCQTDFDDIRFTDDDGDSELDYWMEEYTASADATFWVEVADNLDSNQTIYIYYGNSTVSTTSNGDNTFHFFDAFSSTLDTSKWDTVQGSISTSGGYLELEGTSGTRGLIEAKSGYAFGQNHSLVINAYASDTQQDNAHFLSARASGSWTNRVDFYGGTSANSLVAETWADGSKDGPTYVDVVDISATHEYSWTWENGEANYYQDTTLEVTHTGNVPSTDLEVVFYEGNIVTDTFYIDWMFVRKWIATEPSPSSYGTEETEPVGEYSVTIYEVIDLSDAVSTVLDGAVTVYDSFSLAEAISTVLDADVIVLEVIPIYDSTSTAVQFFETIFEMIPFFDSVFVEVNPIGAIVIYAVIPFHVVEEVTGGLDGLNIFYDLFLGPHAYSYIGPLALVVTGYLLMRKDTVLGILCLIVQWLFVGQYLSLVDAHPDYWWHIVIILLGGLLTCVYQLWDH